MKSLQLVHGTHSASELPKPSCLPVATCATTASENKLCRKASARICKPNASIKVTLLHGLAGTTARLHASCTLLTSLTPVQRHRQSPGVDACQGCSPPEPAIVHTALL
jgi:hypothetical protein